ncbi:uncharacterized protein BXZ73DRAFT_75755 [Epithele typhae]|uniref:uncharacterized protein n=1 Tax=Epithele typhae TaxID=378194 RepID=UPI0020088D3B|nr:uncharacterized protein BXZ73DRAFT_75755 [Epithele typhae]KAH9940155.1 hypothetical protein BXZ73DRAFT_75755 [Epithele typhae]
MDPNLPFTPINHHPTDIFDEGNSTTTSALDFSSSPFSSSPGFSRYGSQFGPHYRASQETHDDLRSAHSDLQNNFARVQAELEAERAIRSALAQALANSAGNTTGPPGGNVARSRPKKTDYPNIRYWFHHEYLAQERAKRQARTITDPAQDLTEDINDGTPKPGKRGPTRAAHGYNDTFQWLEDETGKPVSGAYCTLIRARSRAIWERLLEDNRAPAKWGRAPTDVRTEYIEEMEGAFPELGYCEAHYKAILVATMGYPAFIRGRKAALANGSNGSGGGDNDGDHPGSCAGVKRCSPAGLSTTSHKKVRNSPPSPSPPSTPTSLSLMLPDEVSDLMENGYTLSTPPSPVIGNEDGSPPTTTLPAHANPTDRPRVQIRNVFTNYLEQQALAAALQKSALPESQVPTVSHSDAVGSTEPASASTTSTPSSPVQSSGSTDMDVTIAPAQDGQAPLHLLTAAAGVASGHPATPPPLESSPTVPVLVMSTAPVQGPELPADMADANSTILLGQKKPKPQPKRFTVKDGCMTVRSICGRHWLKDHPDGSVPEFNKHWKVVKTTPNLVKYEEERQAYTVFRLGLKGRLALFHLLLEDSKAGLEEGERDYIHSGATVTQTWLPAVRALGPALKHLAININDITTDIGHWYGSRTEEALRGSITGFYDVLTPCSELRSLCVQYEGMPSLGKFVPDSYRNRMPFVIRPFFVDALTVKLCGDRPLFPHLNTLEYRLVGCTSECLREGGFEVAFEKQASTLVRGGSCPLLRRLVVGFEEQLEEDPNRAVVVDIDQRTIL